MQAPTRPTFYIEVFGEVVKQATVCAELVIVSVLWITTPTSQVALL